MLPDDWHLTEDVDDFLVGECFRRGMAAAHGRRVGTLLADAPVPSRHSRRAAAAPPARRRGSGYAGAVTAEVSEAALTAGASDVVLFTDPDNPTSNGLYQRIGYVHVADFAGYRFPSRAPQAG